jgi:hypothetical protein
MMETWLTACSFVYGQAREGQARTCHGAFVKRRATKRFRVELPITVRWMNPSGIGEAQTESEDIALEAFTSADQGLLLLAVLLLAVSHQLRPRVAFFLGYGANLDGSNTAACAAPNCASNFITNTISIGFNRGLRRAAVGNA